MMYLLTMNLPFTRSIDSASSIVRHISTLGVEQDPPMEPTSLSSAAKRRKGNSEDDSASSGLKRSKA